MDWAALGSKRTCGPSIRTRVSPLSKKGASSCLAIVDSSAPIQRVWTNNELTFATARMRPSIACFRPSSVSD